MTTVFRWLAKFADGGQKALLAKPIPGRPPKVSAEELRWIARTVRDETTIYSGELAERSAPTATERTMTIAFEGQSAKEVFDSIGPDVHPSCSEEKDYRDRSKKGVTCNYTPKDGCRCWIGLNLRTGESIPTVSC